MKRIAKLIDGGFESSSIKTPEFKSFARKFRNDMRREVERVGGVLLECNAGHFYMYGFFAYKQQIYYFSIPDVRWFPEKKLLIRTAKGLKDFTGGTNTYQEIKEGMFEEYFKTEKS